MKVTEYYPINILKPFVKVIKIIECGDGEIQNRVLPNTSLSMAFCIIGQNSYTMDSGNFILPKSVISGLRKSVRLINYSKNTSTIIVLFNENGAGAFFKVPLHRLFEESISLDNIVNPSEIRDTEELLCGAKTNFQRVKIIEQFLLNNLINRKPDTLISDAVAKIHQANGNIRMSKLADLHYISSDAFEKRFRKNIGSSPKQFASIVRMFSIISQKENRRILGIALDAGFYDQAHFNNNFKLFTGQTPTEFYKTGTFW